MRFDVKRVILFNKEVSGWSKKNFHFGIHVFFLNDFFLILFTAARKNHLPFATLLSLDDAIPQHVSLILQNCTFSNLIYSAM